MRHIGSVFSYELRRNLSRKGFLFTTFGLPLIGFVIFFGYQLISGAQSPEEQLAELQFNLRGISQAGYIDHSGQFDEPGPLAHMMNPYADKESAQAALEAGQIDVYYVIAADYTETGSVRMVVPTFAPNMLTSAPVEQMFYSQLVDQVDLPLLQRLHNPSVIERVELVPDAEDGVVRDEDTDFALVYGFAIIFMLALFGTNGYLMQSVIEEKETRLIEILISSVRPIQLLAGKILALGLLGIFQVGIYVLSVILITQIAAQSTALAGSFLANITIPLGALPLLGVYFVLGYLMFAAIYGAVGALSNSMSEGPNIAVIFTLPAVGPLYFLPVFLHSPNDTLAVALSLFPLSAPMSMVMRLSIAEVPLVEVVLSIILLVAAIAFLMWCAGRLFRVQTLLAGHRPKLKDIPRLVRQ
jgi:ABC-2 type transport system permease protein